MAEFVVESTVEARPETVFDVYTDHRGYADLIGAVRSAELEREGKPAPNGLGAIRRLRLPGATVREEVTGFERPGRYSYRLLSGLPLDRMEATVTFAPTDRGTAVSYQVSVAGSARALPVESPTRQFIHAFVRSAGAEAERREAAAS